MEQAIIGYHQDEEDDWVAQLQCGHCQHVWHNTNSLRFVTLLCSEKISQGKALD